MEGNSVFGDDALAEFGEMTFLGRQLCMQGDWKHPCNPFRIPTHNPNLPTPPPTTPLCCQAKGRLANLPAISLNHTLDS